MTAALRSPSHLRKATRAWWRQVATEYDLESHHLKLLTLAAEAWDRCQEAREAIDHDGAYLRDRFGQLKPHPAVAVERDSRVGFCRTMRELDLDGEPAPDPRPTRLR